MIEIDPTNEVMMSYYKKQELMKAKQRLEQKMSKADIIKLADKRVITAEEIKEQYTGIQVLLQNNLESSFPSQYGIPSFFCL